MAVMGVFVTPVTPVAPITVENTTNNANNAKNLLRTNTMTSRGKYSTSPTAHHPAVVPYYTLLTIPSIISHHIKPEPRNYSPAPVPGYCSILILTHSQARLCFCSVFSRNVPNATTPRILILPPITILTTPAPLLSQNPSPHYQNPSSQHQNSIHQPNHNICPQHHLSNL